MKACNRLLLALVFAIISALGRGDVGEGGATAHGKVRIKAKAETVGEFKVKEGPLKNRVTFYDNGCVKFPKDMIVCDDGRVCQTVPESFFSFLQSSPSPQIKACDVNNKAIFVNESWEFTSGLVKKIDKDGNLQYRNNVMHNKDGKWDYSQAKCPSRTDWKGKTIEASPKQKDSGTFECIWKEYNLLGMVKGGYKTFADARQEFALDGTSQCYLSPGILFEESIGCERLRSSSK